MAVYLECDSIAKIVLLPTLRITQGPLRICYIIHLPQRAMRKCWSHRVTFKVKDLLLLHHHQL